jgi:cyclic pyranopterin phosphate synthase
MRDRYGRKIEYLRLSLTDRCNFRCIYCSNGSVPLTPRDDLLSLGELESIVGVMAEMGIKYIRLTGGEPLLRKGIEKLITRLKRIPGIQTVGLTTNGLLLEEKLEGILRAGVDSLNVSVDSLNEKLFSEITRGGDLRKVLRGIKRAQLACNQPVKINTVITKYLPSEIIDFLTFAEENDLILKFIELMPLKGLDLSKLYLSPTILEKQLQEISPLIPLYRRYGNGPARYFMVRSTGVKIGIIAAISHGYCKECNRVRLTSDGFLLPCIGSTSGVNLRNILRNGRREYLYEAFQKLISSKPLSHNFGRDPIRFWMNQLGG